MSHKDFQQMMVKSLQLGIRFLFNTFFRCKKKTKIALDEWVEAIDNILDRSKEASHWLVDYLSSREGSSFIKPFLLECPCRDVRYTMARILDRVMSSYFRHGGVPTQKSFNEILEIILQMLNKDVVDHCKNSFHYFHVLKSYVQLGTKSCSHMFLRQGFQRLIAFLIGSQANDSNQESHSRRWSSIQSREFGNLHSTLAILILNCDVSKYRTEDLGDYQIRKPTTVYPTKFLLMPADMENFVFGQESSRYVREVIHAVRELGTSQSIIGDMLIYCSFCNHKFSITVLKHLMHQYMTAPSNELKTIFQLLTDILMLEDPVQLRRLQMVIDGYSELGTIYDGLLATVRNNHVQDSRRSYSCIKFLVTLANKCSLAKDYLMQFPSKWQWAVNWLKKKMSEYYWSPSSASGLSNEDSNRKSFQRTFSAQSTLEEAKALLTELEAHEGNPDMEINDEGKGDKSIGETDSQMSTESDEQSSSTSKKL